MKLATIRRQTMSRGVVVRYETRPEAAEENQRLVENVFSELNRSQPDGLRYATFRLADGVSFVHVAIQDGEDNVLSAVAAFAEFQRDIASRVVQGPDASGATLVGSYHLYS
jgi:hypothetical protein